jgi:hypothetical protein
VAPTPTFVSPQIPVTPVTTNVIDDDPFGFFGGSNTSTPVVTPNLPRASQDDIEFTDFVDTTTNIDNPFVTSNFPTNIPTNVPVSIPTTIPTNTPTNVVHSTNIFPINDKPTVISPIIMILNNNR